MEGPVVALTGNTPVAKEWWQCRGIILPFHEEGSELDLQRHLMLQALGAWWLLEHRRTPNSTGQLSAVLFWPLCSNSSAEFCYCWSSAAKMHEWWLCQILCSYITPYFWKSDGQAQVKSTSESPSCIYVQSNSLCTPAPFCKSSGSTPNLDAGNSWMEQAGAAHGLSNIQWQWSSMG